MYEKRVPDVWICKCGTSRKQIGGGFTNLVSHVARERYEDYKNLVNQYHSSNGAAVVFTSTPSLFFRKKVTHIHLRIDIIINDPVKCFERNVPTFHKYLPLLTIRVERKIKNYYPRNLR